MEISIDETMARLPIFASSKLQVLSVAAAALPGQNVLNERYANRPLDLGNAFKINWLIRQPLRKNMLFSAAFPINSEGARNLKKRNPS